MGHISQPRSCDFCAKSKIRCNKKRPQCSRCTASGIECHYTSKPVKTQKRGVQAVNSSNPGINHQRELNGNNIRYDEPVVTNQGVAAVDNEYANWDIPNIQLPDSELTGSFNFISETNIFALPADHLLFGLSPGIDQELQRNIPVITDWPIPTSPTTRPHSLAKRPTANAGVERTSKLLLHTLQSYVLSMLSHNSLPPFIHSSLVSAGFDTEPLINCINLVYMIGGKMEGRQKLFWRNVRMECERMCNEV